jgi:transformer-2 protein
MTETNEGWGTENNTFEEGQHHHHHSEENHHQENHHHQQQPSEEDISPNSGESLYVKGIAPSTTETELADLFSKYGKVLNIRLMMDPYTKENRGFGFIQMETVEGAESAIQGLTDFQLNGKTLNIEKSKRGRPRTVFFYFLYS